ncbi:hypothetical protein CIN_09150 [Commensalibacter intestini A911]|uniref:FUSC family protein n=1 Tax=Commensalibacter intestini A911 TaxID=1088868 RepID=G6EZP5_9PROT|nr:FUSC family protein [Commensalibacter intestini]EHD14983.1 hypothetical protein CIN_09150 [Commensalibacter intestini A911]
MFSFLKRSSLNSHLSNLKWLYAPTPSAIVFALQTSAAAFVGLYIAFWMQLDSPYWAAITVWVVSLATPEENDSKAHWLIVGTLIGAITGILIVAAFPQQPALFIILVGMWVSGCCFMSRFMSNFRVHAFRMAAITGALVALDSVSNPNSCFDVAFSRGSYVILGVFLQKLFSSICVGDRLHIRVEWLQKKLTENVNTTCLMFSNFFAGNNDNLNKNKSIFLNIYDLNQQSEFVDLAAESRSHLGAHGRMTLSIANGILIKIFCLENLLKTSPTHKQLGDLPNRLSAFFIELPKLIISHHNTSFLTNTFEKIQQHFYEKLEELGSTFIHPDKNNSAKEAEFYFTHCAIIYDILTEIELLFQHFNAHIRPNQSIYSKIYSYTNFYKAFYTWLRIFSAILIGGIIWEITAWENGSLFILFICILSCIIHLTDLPRPVSIGFFKGTCFAIFVTSLINFVFIPKFYTIDGLAYLLIICMVVAGLAVSKGVMRINTIAYSIFFFVLVQYNNQHIINETTYFNMALCVFMSAAFITLTTFLIFPFSDKNESYFACKKLIKNVQQLTWNVRQIPSTQEWIAAESCNLVYMLRHITKRPQEEQNQYFFGALASISIGIQLIKIRLCITDNKMLSKEFKRLFKDLCKAIRTRHPNQKKTHLLYYQLIDYIQQQESKKEYVHILASLCILKSQLKNYEDFIIITNRSRLFIE